MGGVTTEPGAGFWPVVMAALGSAVVSVEVEHAEVVDGLDRAARLVLRSAEGRRARADLRWDSAVAEASLEAADAAHVARVDVWPAPAAEFDGEPAGGGAAPDAAHPLRELGFVAQIERLARGRGR